MLNPIMLKKGQNLGEKSSHVSATDELVNSLRNELFEQGEAVTIPNLEAKLHAWSVETVLRLLHLFIILCALLRFIPPKNPFWYVV